ncbi:D-alanine transaminase/branched-chain amino acid aminotransferase [Pedobacter sp. AK017]|uniref:aminotransferase class IV n=1 Tax=Pedobacter sp. AK017 TaxID=2723073 RepID=UPI00160CEA5D|nr:aminotransferase class IV [Pedobacter sp. AK017]MBB5440383.1 D-alanine transaminase/branched-chain amino acid aminotransferase [Pedobacter sp. AK017]
MNNNFVFINDAFFQAEHSAILIKDLSVQRGYGIFDFFKTVNSKPVFLDDHLDRFYYSAAQMHLQVGLSRSQLKEILAELMKRNNLPDSGIRITLTGGYSEDGYNLAEKPNLIITQNSFAINQQAINKGIKLVTYNYQRQLSHIKTLDYLTAIWLQPYIKEHAAEDVLYHNNGALRECPRANFFLVTAANEVLTAGESILKGITRKNILNLVQTDILVAERAITLDDLATAKEAFITSTTKNIMPVTSIDGKNIGNGTIGPVTSKLQELLRQKASTATGI